MPTLRSKVERNPYFLDRDNEQSYAQNSDESSVHDFNYTNELGGNETVTASAWDESGVTTSDKSLATPVATVKVTGTDGWVEHTATITDSSTSIERTVVRKLNFYNRVK